MTINTNVNNKNNNDNNNNNKNNDNLKPVSSSSLEAYWHQELRFRGLFKEVFM